MVDITLFYHNKELWFQFPEVRGATFTHGRQGLQVGHYCIECDM